MTPQPGNVTEEIYRIRDRMGEMEKTIAQNSIELNQMLTRKIEAFEEKMERQAERSSEKKERLVAEMREELQNIFTKIEEVNNRLVKIEAEAKESQRRIDQNDANLNSLKNNTIEGIKRIHKRIDPMEQTFTQAEGGKKTVKLVVWIFGAISTVAAGVAVLAQFLK